MSEQVVELTIPIVLMVLIPMAGVFAMRDRATGRLPLLEIGVVYMGVAALYGTIPLVNYLYHGLKISREADFRLMALDPTPQDFISLAWYQVIYLACFLVGYTVVRGKHAAKITAFVRPESRTMIGMVLLLIAVEIFFIWLRAAYEVETPRNYADANKVARQYPLLLRQVANHLQGVEWTLKLMVIIWALLNFKKSKWALLTWLALETAMMLSALGARQPYFIVIAMAASAYHLLVKPISTRVLLLGAAATLAFFVTLGYVRLGREIGGVGGSGVQSAGVLEASNEFEALLTNALDVRRLRDAGFGDEIQGSLYFADLYKLVPQQLLPFEKISPLEWYANSFYESYVDFGGGFAFGAISEAMLGTGIPDLIWRGLVLGVVYAALHRYLVATTRTTFFKVTSYIWLTVLSFLSFRDSTFAFVSGYCYRFVPVMFGMFIISAFLEQRLLPRPIFDRQRPA